MGAPGSSGLDGAAPGAAGTPGGAAPAALRDLASTDAVNLLQVTGGPGGNGGNGALGAVGQPPGASGAGGAGGLGSATLAVLAPATATSFQVAGNGGAGGNGGVTGMDELPWENDAAGGNGGNGYALGVLRSTGATVQASAAATGGSGGNTLFGQAGHGGSAAASLGLTLVGAHNAGVSSIATGGSGGGAAGNPFETPVAGVAGSGGAATSTVAVIATPPATDAWNALIDARSTALAGDTGSGYFTSNGSTARADVHLVGYGRSSGQAIARGSAGSDSGGYAEARAVVSASQSAIATADASGGGASYNAGAGARAYAQASAQHHARAGAIAASGSGRFGSGEATSAEAVATVYRPATVLQAATTLPAEARADAIASWGGGTVVASSNYRDAALGASVNATASSAVVNDYAPQAHSAANIGGAVYGRWTIDDANPTQATSYASALPGAAALAPLLAGAPVVSAAFEQSRLLGVGTLGAAFTPFAASARYTLPYVSGQHLLLGLFNPAGVDGYDASFTFSVSHGDTVLYSGSFTSAAQTAALFGDIVLDLGAIDADTLDLLVRYSLSEGAYGFNYVLGAVTAVPEPSTWLALLLGLVMLGLRAAQLHARPQAAAGRLS